MKLLLPMLLFATAAAAAEPLRDVDRREVVARVARLLEEQYVFPDRGRAMATTLRERLASGAYDIHDGETFAQRITDDLQRVSEDGHLRVEYRAEPLPENEDEANAEHDAEEAERYYGAHLNFGFERAERLEHNIGLLDLRVFAPVAMGGDTAAAAMRMLARTDALIIDLRRNGGGDGDMAALLASYLFDRGTRPLSGSYSRPEDRLTQSSTQPYVPGPRYGETKPVFLLTSKATFSAAESFAYDLRALGRVTVVGEPTGGGAHPFEYRKVHAHFVLWLVTGRSVNPITGTNWQTVGVQPDVAVPAEEALPRAIALAHEALRITAR